MKVIICIKAVPLWLVDKDCEEKSGYAMNPYDTFALKRILDMKEKLDLYVTCLCMGPESARDVLKRCYAMGADSVLLLSDRKFAGSDTYATSKVLATAIKRLDYDFIVCGNEAIDGETGQVVCGIAERLGLYCVPQVENILENESKEELRLLFKENDLEKVVDVKIPAVISFGDLCIQNDISFLKLKRARSKEVVTWCANDLNIDQNECGQAGSKTKVIRTNSICRLDTRNAELMEGTDNSVVELILKQIYTYQ
jgi:electron transfer flavoprotein beta subunit